MNINPYSDAIALNELKSIKQKNIRHAKRSVSNCKSNASNKLSEHNLRDLDQQNLIISNDQINK